KGLALQPDGKILVVNVTSNSEQLIRYNPDGSPDPSFAPSLRVFSGIAVQPDGKIVTESPLARFNPDGSVDPLFGMNGHAVDVTFGGQVVVAPDGEIIAIGQVGIAVYKLNGTLNVRFGNAGLVTP